MKYLIRFFLKYSINLYGETFLKTLGKLYFKEGSTYNGRVAVNMILKNYGLPENEIFIADGSGLSQMNLLTPSYLSMLLYKIYKESSFYETFYNALSVSGISGTLKKKLNTDYLAGAIHAKTGQIRNAVALSGYIDTLGGDRLAFSILANNNGKHFKGAENIIKKVCSYIRKLDK